MFGATRTVSGGSGRRNGGVSNARRSAVSGTTSDGALSRASGAMPPNERWMCTIPSVRRTALIGAGNGPTSYHVTQTYSTCCVPQR